jgi:hypothetical protein
MKRRWFIVFAVAALPCFVLAQQAAHAIAAAALPSPVPQEQAAQAVAVTAPLVLAQVTSPAPPLRQPVCTNGQLGPPTISQRISALDPKYGFYCGADNRCPGGQAGCNACDAVDEGCKAHDLCWEQGACAGPKSCNIDEFGRLSARDLLPASIGNLTAIEKSRLAKMRACDVALCNDMRQVTRVTADSNEGRLMAESTFGCSPHLVHVLGGIWKMSNGVTVDLKQTGNRVDGNWSASGGGGTVSGTFDGQRLVGQFTFRDSGGSGNGPLNLIFTTTYNNGPQKNLVQDRLKDDAYSAFPDGPWAMTRD